jgi:protein-disulfide isomerase
MSERAFGLDANESSAERCCLRTGKAIFAASMMSLWLVAGPGWSESPHPAAARAAENRGLSSTLEDEHAKLMALVQSRRRPVSEQDGEIDISGLPALGSWDAAVAIIEFSSYQCGFCRRHFTETLPIIKAEYIDSGRLLYVFRDIALDPDHEHAASAAEASYCAAEQGRFEAFREELFGRRKGLDPESLTRSAQSIGLDLQAHRACLDSGRHRAKTRVDPRLRQRLSLRGTPTFIIGFPNEDGTRLVAVRRITGARSFALFERQLEEIIPVLSQADVH